MKRATAAAAARSALWYAHNDVCGACAVACPCPLAEAWRTVKPKTLNSAAENEGGEMLSAWRKLAARRRMAELSAEGREP